MGGLPKSSSEDSKWVAKAAKGEPPTSIDRLLVDAVHNPQFRGKLLCIEKKIQQVLKNPNLEKVEFPECHTAHLKFLADKLALHYSLESHCKERRAFARKTPDSKIPSVTLSGIPEINPKDKLPILIMRSSDAASSSTLSVPELIEPVNKEEEYYKARERIFNEPVPASSTAPLVSRSTPPAVPSSISPVASNSISLVVPRSISLAVPSSTSPTHSGIVEEGDQDSLSDRHAAMNPAVSSSSPPAVSSPISPVASKSISPVVPRSISPEVPNLISPTYSGIVEEGNQDSMSARHAATNPVHNPGANTNHDPTSLTYGRGTGVFIGVPTTGQQPLLMQNDRHAARNPVHNPGANMNHNPTRSTYGRGSGRGRGRSSRVLRNDAIPFRHQAVQYEPRIQQPQMYQYEPSIQQPQMYQYAPSIQQPQMYQCVPSIQQPQMFTPYYNYDPNYASSGLYNPAYTSYAQWPRVQHMQTFNQQPINSYGVSTSPYYASSAPYNPAYSSYPQPQVVWVQPMQPFSQEPMQYQPGTAQQPMQSFSQVPMQYQSGTAQQAMQSFGQEPMQYQLPGTAQQPMQSFSQETMQYQPETAQPHSNSIIQNNQVAVIPAGRATDARPRRRSF